MRSKLQPVVLMVVHSGNYRAFMGDISLAVLSQTLPTSPGKEYLLSFWLDNPMSGPGQQFEVNWNTNAPVTNTVYYALNPPAFTWTNFNFVLAATGTNTTLQFGAENQPNYFGLDDISVLAVPVPSISGVAGSSNGVTFTWNSLPNVPYVVQFTTNLEQPNWTALGSSITAATNSLRFLDTNVLTAAPALFYRVIVGP